MEMHKAVVLIGHPLELAVSPLGPGEPGTACEKGKGKGGKGRRERGVRAEVWVRRVMSDGLFFQRTLYSVKIWQRLEFGNLVSDLSGSKATESCKRHGILHAIAALHFHSVYCHLNYNIIA